MIGRWNRDIEKQNIPCTSQRASTCSAVTHFAHNEGRDLHEYCETKLHKKSVGVVGSNQESLAIKSKDDISISANCIYLADLFVKHSAQ